MILLFFSAFLIYHIDLQVEIVLGAVLVDHPLPVTHDLTVPRPRPAEAGMKEDGQIVPSPSSSVDYVEVAA